MLETEIAECPPTQAPIKKQSRSFLQIPWWIISLASLFCTALVLYTPALQAGYFSDDFLFCFTAPPTHFYEYFFRIGSAIHAYRPLEAIILTATQQHFQFETMPIHLLALACHAGLACLLISAARKLKLDTTETLVACAVLFCSQVGVSALNSADGGKGCFMPGFGRLPTEQQCYFTFSQGMQLVEHLLAMAAMVCISAQI